MMKVLAHKKQHRIHSTRIALSKQLANSLLKESAFVLQMTEKVKKAMLAEHPQVVALEIANEASTGIVALC